MKWIRSGPPWESSGIDVSAKTKREALQLISGDGAYIVHGTFNPEATIQIFNDAIEQAYTDGFTGFRAAAEMSWALNCADGAHQVIVYEALLKSLFASCRAIGLCLYDRKRMPLQVINGALSTHPVAGSHGSLRRQPVLRSGDEPAPPASIRPRVSGKSSRSSIVRAVRPSNNLVVAFSRRIGAPAFGCGTSQPRA